MVRHARDANELLEIASDELRAVVGDDSRLRFRVLLLGSLRNHFDVGFSHGPPEIPMHEETAEPIQNAAQVIEGAARVDGLLFHWDNNPACFNTRQTLAGLTATTSASSIMNVSRR